MRSKIERAFAGRGHLDDLDELALNNNPMITAVQCNIEII
jgi:hypothetical protein